MLLGTEYVLLVKTQNYHWNITGMSFSGLHSLLGDQYKALQEFVDRIAEQIRKYDQPSPGSMKEFLELNKVIAENRGGQYNPQLMIEDLAMNNEYLTSLINRFDLATQNMLGEIQDFHMKNTWMLRAHLM